MEETFKELYYSTYTYALFYCNEKLEKKIALNNKNNFFFL